MKHAFFTFSSMVSTIAFLLLTTHIAGFRLKTKTQTSAAKRLIFEASTANDAAGALLSDYAANAKFHMDGPHGLPSAFRAIIAQACAGLPESSFWNKSSPQSQLAEKIQPIADEMSAYERRFTQGRGNYELRDRIVNLISGISKFSREAYMRLAFQMRLLDDEVAEFKYQHEMTKYNYNTSGFTGALWAAVTEKPERATPLSPAVKQKLVDMMATYHQQRQRDAFFEGSMGAAGILAQVWAHSILPGKKDPVSWTINGNAVIPFMRLGAGSFGDVFACIDGAWLKRGMKLGAGSLERTDPREYVTAVKVMDKSHLARRGMSSSDVGREADTWETLSSRNASLGLGMVLPFLGMSSDQSEYQMQSELAPGGHLQHWLEIHVKELPLRHLANMLTWVVDMFDQLILLRQTRMVHRDIKPENYFIGPDDRLWLGDFGLTRRCDSDQRCPATEKCGTPAFMDPFLHGFPRSAPDSYNSDLWAVGLSAYAILYTGIKRKPFSHPAIISGGRLAERGQLGPMVIAGFTDNIISTSGLLDAWKALFATCQGPTHAKEYETAFRKQGTVLKEAMQFVLAGKEVVSMRLLQTWRSQLRAAADDVPE